MGTNDLVEHRIGHQSNQTYYYQFLHIAFLQTKIKYYYYYYIIIIFFYLFIFIFFQRFQFILNTFITALSLPL